MENKDPTLVQEYDPTTQMAGCRQSQKCKSTPETHWPSEGIAEVGDFKLKDEMDGGNLKRPEIAGLRDRLHVASAPGPCSVTTGNPLSAANAAEPSFAVAATASTASSSSSSAFSSSSSSSSCSFSSSLSAFSSASTCVALEDVTAACCSSPGPTTDEFRPLSEDVIFSDTSATSFQRLNCSVKSEPLVNGHSGLTDASNGRPEEVVAEPSVGVKSACLRIALTPSVRGSGLHAVSMAKEEVPISTLAPRFGQPTSASTPKQEELTCSGPGAEAMGSMTATTPPLVVSSASVPPPNDPSLTTACSSAEPLHRSPRPLAVGLADYRAQPDVYQLPAGDTGSSAAPVISGGNGGNYLIESLSSGPVQLREEEDLAAGATGEVGLLAGADSITYTLLQAPRPFTAGVALSPGELQSESHAIQPGLFGCRSARSGAGLAAIFVARGWYLVGTAPGRAGPSRPGRSHMHPWGHWGGWLEPCLGSVGPAESGGSDEVHTNRPTSRQPPGVLGAEDQGHKAGQPTGESTSRPMGWSEGTGGARMSRPDAFRFGYGRQNFSTLVTVMREDDIVCLRKICFTPRSEGRHQFSRMHAWPQCTLSHDYQHPTHRTSTLTQSCTHTHTLIYVHSHTYTYTGERMQTKAAKLN
ncbi:unnamed protein product [Protopolystoma xenopodis]|uniref:Uncharacterized protein n=1 Tax=Protopolystoma xenopodis TaxID=117903 RepID=A0A448WUL5_9PLAT|nr:unnamed protein product [Protopolystoma xenopodis]